MVVIPEGLSWMYVPRQAATAKTITARAVTFLLVVGNAFRMRIFAMSALAVCAEEDLRNHIQGLDGGALSPRRFHVERRSQER